MQHRQHLAGLPAPPDAPDAPELPDTTETRSFAFDHLDANAVVIDGAGRIVDTNEGWRLFTALNDGRPDATGCGVHYLEVCDRAAAAGDEHAALAADGLRKLLAGELNHFDLEYPCSSPTQDRWYLLHASPAPVAQGNGAVVLHIEVTAAHMLRERLAATAEHDERTGLPNRAVAVRGIERLLAGAGQHGLSASVVRIVIRGYDEAVAAHGARVAEQLVVQTVARARRVLRHGDLLCRWAPDHLVMALSGLDRDELDSVAARLREVLDAPFQFGGTRLEAHAAVGVALGTSASTVASLLGDAANDAGVPVPDELPAANEARRTGPLPSRTDVLAGTAPLGPARLQEALDRAEAIFEHSSDLVLFFRSDGTIEWVSPASRTFLGVAPAELVGRSGFEMIHPDDWDRVAVDFAGIGHLGDSVRTEFRIVTPNGERWVEEIATNLLEEPSVGAIVGNLRDITDRKRSEEAVRFQARMLAASGQAIVAIDNDLVINFWNDAAHELFGWNAEEMVGQHLSVPLRTSNGWEALLDHVVVQIQDGRPWSGRTRIPRADGTEIPVHLACTAVFDDDGQHIATIGVSTDLTEQLRSEAATAMLSAIVESSNDAIFLAGRDGRITTWNAGAAQLFGHDESEVLGRNVASLVPKDHAGRLEELHARTRRGEQVTNVDLPGRRTDGTTLHLSMSISPVWDRQGRLIGVSTIARDVSERVALQMRIEEDRRKLNDAQASARLGSFEFDRANGIGQRSDELCRILGVEDRTFDLALPSTHPEDEAKVREFLARSEDGSECIHRIVRPDGTLRWVLTRIGRIGERRDDVVTGTMLDITERYEAQLALAHQATHDPLTDLPNRTSLVDRLQELLAAGERVAMAFVDLDRFKRINDTLGHRIGDEVLATVAARLSDGLRSGDIVARFGGDEFVLVRPGAQGVEEGRELADDAVLALLQPVHVSGRRFDLTASIGVAVSDAADTAESLLRDADAAMFQAKADGRARTAVFDGTARARAHRRVTLQTALQQALDHEELRLAYQPIVQLDDERVAGFESLLRWEHPTLGPVGPDEFIPIAEATGLIVPIGDWVIGQAVEQLARWRHDQRVRDDLWVAVNLSTPQLGHPGLVDRVVTVLRETGLPPELLHLEITESLLIDRVENAMTTLAALRALGVRVSIDDFGTGYSSLSYLSRLSTDTVKIDRSFIQDLGSEGHDGSIVTAITALASSLGLDVVAEGIEVREQLELLRGLGCRFGQGYYWSKPLFPEQAFEWMIGRPERLTA